MHALVSDAFTLPYLDSCFTHVPFYPDIISNLRGAGGGGGVMHEPPPKTEEAFVELSMHVLPLDLVSPLYVCVCLEVPI